MINIKNKYKFILWISLIIFLYFVNSILLNKNHYTNHLFLIFNEAHEFLNGLHLYKEVYVTYGIGQTLINAASLLLFGENWFSIYLVANIFYFLSFFFICFICLQLRFSYFEILFTILILINIHPKLVLPWSTYLAFLPLVLSLYFLLKDKKINYLLSGLFLASACLIRETIIISAIIIFVCIVIYLIINKKKNMIIFYISGFFLPLSIFSVYMFVTSNYLIWYELIFPAYKHVSLINVGYYINDNNSYLRKIYIYFLSPFRSLGLTFLDTLLNFWSDWVLIYASYICCIIVLYKEIFKKKKLVENNFQIVIISIYSLSLVIQNLHQVEIFRVSTGSIIGILVLNYYFIKMIKNSKIKNVTYLLILIFLYINSYGTWGRQMTNKDFYKLSFDNIKNNLNNIFTENKKLINYEKVEEFGPMNYDSSIHKFFTKFRKDCENLTNEKGIKYSYNHDNAWELNYFCGTRPAYYFLFPSKQFVQIYKDSKYIKKNNVTNDNTIEFFLSNEPYLNKYKILKTYDIKDYPADLFFGKKYLLILQNKK
jgi:hypothetical protein